MVKRSKKGVVRQPVWLSLQGHIFWTTHIFCGNGAGGIPCNLPVVSQESNCVCETYHSHVILSQEFACMPKIVA